MYIHLRVHSHYSILDSNLNVEIIPSKAKSYNMPAIALTDNSNLYGLPKFFDKSKENEIKPIIGVHTNIAPRSRFDKVAKIDEKTSTITLLAKNFIGYKNLIKIISYSHIEGFYYKPRVDKELLEKYKEGIICLIGGPKSQLTNAIYTGNEKEIEQIIDWYTKTFGDDFYVEIQRLGYQYESYVNDELIKLAKEKRIKLVATNPVYYLTKEDAEIREVMWAIDDGKKMSDPSRRKQETHEAYFKSPEEMEKLFEDLPEAIKATLEIAEKVEQYNISHGKVQPVYPFIPEGETEESFLRKLVFANAEKRFGYYNKELEDRLNYELQVIHEKGYDGYFLVVWSIVNWARENGIFVSTRGSAAGSAVAYAIGITTVDPIKYELIFERFLNPERKSFPDIDLDIADHGREKVIEFVKKTYGEENVCNVGAIGKLTTRNAIRDAARVLDIDLKTADSLSKLVPVTFGKVMPIYPLISDLLASNKEKGILDKNREKIQRFREILKGDGSNLVQIKACLKEKRLFYDTKETHCKCGEELTHLIDVTAKHAKLIQYVKGLENSPRNISTHACGYLITPNPIIEYCPVQKERQSGNRIITQIEGAYLEGLGMMKFDFLGLINLSTIDKAIELIKKYRNISIDVFSIPEDDQKAYEILQKGDTTGIFQLESAGMRKYLKELKPTKIEEIVAMCALYRPGPLEYIPKYINRKHGREPVEYIIPELEPILKISYGFAIYQEQLLRIAHELCGYTLGGADNIRKAVGKKLNDLIAQEEVKFKEGFVKNFPQYGKEIADQLWQYVLPFADYGFNKSHSAAYGYIAYITAYLKANYTIEYYVAMMFGYLDKLEKIAKLAVDASAHGIKILPPSINKSDVYFTIEDQNNIRFGLGSIKGVGDNAVKNIVEEREKNGEYLSLDDFCYRVDHRAVTKKCLEILIKIGAFDEFGDRNGLLEIYEKIYSKFHSSLDNVDNGMPNLFGLETIKNTNWTNVTPVPNKDTTDEEKISWELEFLKLQFTKDIGMKVSEYLYANGYNTIGEIVDYESNEIIESDDENETNNTSYNKNEPVNIFGKITKLKIINTKKQEKMGFITVSDQTGSIEVTLFPKVFTSLEKEPEIGNYINIKGTLVTRVIDKKYETELVPEKVKIFTAEQLKKLYDLKISKNKSNPDQKKTVEKQQKTIKLEEKTNTFTLSSKNRIQNDQNNENKTNTKSEKDQNEEKNNKLNNDVIKIIISRGTTKEDLEKFSSYLKSLASDEGVDIYIQIPNHTKDHVIKLKKKYPPDLDLERFQSIIKEIEKI